MDPASAVLPGSWRRSATPAPRDPAAPSSGSVAAVTPVPFRYRKARPEAQPCHRARVTNPRSGVGPGAHTRYARLDHAAAVLRLVRGLPLGGERCAANAPWH